LPKSCRRLSGALLNASAISLLAMPLAQAADDQPSLASNNFGDDPSGSQRPHLIREHDLRLASQERDSDTLSLSCVTLREGTFEPLGDCARPAADGSYVVSAEALRQLDFDGWGLATMAIRERGYAYVRRDGRALIVTTFDNFPDEFNSGLVRVKIGEKLGFANRRLKVVIPATYDGAFTFDKGRAWVCIGCVTVSDGEHSFYKGGTALCIDRRGRTRPATGCGTRGWLPPQLRE
jgi:hypothetical protein